MADDRMIGGLEYWRLRCWSGLCHYWLGSDDLWHSNPELAREFPSKGALISHLLERGSEKGAIVSHAIDVCSFERSHIEERVVTETIWETE